MTNTGPDPQLPAAPPEVAHDGNEMWSAIASAADGIYKSRPVMVLVRIEASVRDECA